MNVLDLALKRVKIRKVSGTNGGEWQGPCPECGGVDRFHVWPVQNEGQGAYWCRGCGKNGDAIQFLRDFERMSFQDACAYLNVPLPDYRDHAPRHTKPEFHPVSHALPADLWQEKADRFIAWSQDSLMKNTEVLSWLSGRGITIETAVNFRLGWNAGENGKDLYRPRKAWGLPDILKDDGRPKSLWLPVGLVIPYIVDRVVYRVRIRRPEGEPRYYVLPGSSMSTMLIGPERRAFVIVESELDAIAVAAASALAGAVAVGSSSAKPDAEASAILKKSLQILNALDFDTAGANAATWWPENFSRCDRWPVPKGKDPGEAFQLGIDLGKWVMAGLPPALTMAAKKEKVIEKPSVEKQVEAVVSDYRVQDLPPFVRELWTLLRKYPHVKVINQPGRYTVLRDGRWVGGRISELVFRTPEVIEYLTNHPAEEIDGENLIIG